MAVERNVGNFMLKFARANREREIADERERMMMMREQQSAAAQKAEKESSGSEKQDASKPKDGAAPKIIAPSTDIGTAPAPTATTAELPMKGGAGSVSPSELYNYLLGHGASRNQAIMLTGAAGAESTWRANLSHDKGTGYGLWGHRNERWDAMANMAGERRPGWQKQADYALWELNNSRDGGIRRANAILGQAQTPREIAVAQMHFERPVGYRPNRPEGGHNFDYRLKLVDQIASGSFGGRATTPAATNAQTTPVRDAGTRPAQYASAATATDAQPVSATVTATPQTTPGATTQQAGPAPTTGQAPPASPAPATTAPATPAPQQQRQLPDMYIGTGNPSKDAAPNPGQTAQQQPATQAAPQQGGEDPIGGFFKSITSVFDTPPIRDQYGREWDSLQGWVDPKTQQPAQSSMLQQSSAQTSGDNGLRDQYGRQWDSLEGWVDPKAKTEPAKSEPAKFEQPAVQEGKSILGENFDPLLNGFSDALKLVGSLFS